MATRKGKAPKLRVKVIVPGRILVRCAECGKAWRVSPNASCLQCSKCNSVDIDVDPRNDLSQEGK